MGEKIKSALLTLDDVTIKMLTDLNLTQLDLVKEFLIGDSVTSETLSEFLPDTIVLDLEDAKRESMFIHKEENTNGD